MWTCPKCGEALEDQFDSCWKCAAPQNVSARPAEEKSRRWRDYYGTGFAFEVLLILLSVCLPRGSWLWAKTFNFLQYSHFVLLSFAQDMDSAGLFGLYTVISAALMALVWATLFFWAIELWSRAAARFGVTQKAKRFLGYGVLVAFAVMAVSMAIDSARNHPRPFLRSPNVTQILNANTALAIDVYRHLKDHPGNLFFSPFSISTALAMTYAGARGITETEIATAAHFNLGQDKLHPAYGQLMDRMHQIQRWRRINLKTANGLWLQRSYTFAQPFSDLIGNEYEGETRLVDFETRAQAASDNINDFVSQKTAGKIPATVQPSQFTPLTKLVLCNALYFKGNWASQFKASATRPGPFHVSSDRAVMVPSMAQKNDFKTARIVESRLNLLELPYYGRDLSMIILLPDTIEGLAQLEEQLNAPTLIRWLAGLDGMQARETIVQLPRFTTSQRLDLIPILKAIGLKSAFDETANFSGMDGTTNLFLSMAAHKALVEVNESGTEAAAVTMFHVATKGMNSHFKVDHPFLYVIRDNASGMILFLGRMVNPAESLTLTER